MFVQAPKTASLLAPHRLHVICTAKKRISSEVGSASISYMLTKGTALIGLSSQLTWRPYHWSQLAFAP
jgi:hypothetical protein